MILIGILLLAAAGITILSITYQAPRSKNLETRTETDGPVTTTTYINGDGRPTVAADKGYASVRKTKNPEGKVILEEYLDAEGEPILLSAGYAAVSYEYEDGLNTEIRYLDEKGKPAVLEAGYDTIRRTYNERRLADTDTYWKLYPEGEAQGAAAGRQITRKDGYAAYRRIYNDKKQAVSLEYRGLDGELANTTSGYAQREREFDEDGRISEERYYRADGTPAALSLGQSGYRRAYDEKGRTMETVYLGADGQPGNTNKGYATVRNAYMDDGSVKTQYYDTDGNPVTIGKSQYGTLTADGERLYLDEDGEIMSRLDNFLDNHPYLVLITGTLAAVAAIFLKGKARWIFLGAYLLFVIYMTMVYREPQDSRRRLELFYSYKRMISNDSVRKDIINNIWLFIPLGAILTRVMPLRSNGWKAAAAAAVCVLISAGIEGIQYAAGIGLCEADDVVSNGLGGLIGAMAAGLWTGRRAGTEDGGGLATEHEI